MGLKCLSFYFTHVILRPQRAINRRVKVHAVADESPRVAHVVGPDVLLFVAQGGQLADVAEVRSLAKIKKEVMKRKVQGLLVVF